MTDPKGGLIMSIYEKIFEIEQEDNASNYGVDPLSYVALGCAR